MPPSNLGVRVARVLPHRLHLDRLHPAASTFMTQSLRTRTLAFANAAPFTHEIFGFACAGEAVDADRPVTDDEIVDIIGTDEHCDDCEEAFWGDALDDEDQEAQTDEAPSRTE